MPPLDLLRDPAWQFAGVIFSIAAIGATFLVYFWQRDRRELAFGTFYQAPLLGVSEELAKRVQISFDGQAISNLQLVVLALKNSGNRAITKSDFERDLRIDMGVGVSILSADVTKQSPPNLAAQVQAHHNHIVVSPLLLNPKDYVLVKLLTTGAVASAQANARIVGISRFVPIKRSDEYVGWRKIRRNVVILPIMCVLFFSFANWSGDRSLLQATIFFSLGILPIAVIQWLLEHFSNHANRYVDGA